MEKIEITLTLDGEKQYALDFYLKKENTTVQRRMDEALKQLYETTVPEDVREYLDAKSAPANFYLETSFDVDAVFGTHVCTAENDDTLNVYADYDMATGQVCDELEVDLHRADGREESLEYRLNAIEKAALLWKMEEYCRQQTGQSLKDYSAALMAEEKIVPPAGPTL